MRAVALVTLVACGSQKDPHPGAGSATVRDASALEVATNLRSVQVPEPVVALPKHVAFHVLDRGRGEHQALRYRRSPGSRTYLTRTHLTSRELTAGTWGATITLPPITNPFAIITPPTGALTLRAERGATDESSPRARQYLASWNILVDHAITLELDERGQLGAVRFAGPPPTPTAVDELTQRLFAMTVPLPEEPVGDGARWRVITVLRQPPAIVKQTATYTLIARHPRWKIDVHIQRIAEPQPLHDPTLPAGVAAELVGGVRELRGTVEVDPAQPLPTGELAVSSTLHLRFATRGSAQDEQIFEDTGTIELRAR